MATVLPCCTRTSVSCLNPTETRWLAWWSTCRSNFITGIFCYSYHFPPIRQQLCEQLLVNKEVFSPGCVRFETRVSKYSTLYISAAQVSFHCFDFFPLLSFHRVSQSVNTKMDATNLARVFGPTLVGHAVPDPDPRTILHDTPRQPRVKWRGLKKIILIFT